jgi:type IV pilus assembly protein PilZ
MATSSPSSLAETSRWEESPWSGGSATSGFLQLRMDTPMDLYQAYIPVFTDGGLFVPTSRDYQLGEELYGLLTLRQETKRHPLLTFPHPAS